MYKPKCGWEPVSSNANTHTKFAGYGISLGPEYGKNSAGTSNLLKYLDKKCF